MRATAKYRAGGLLTAALTALALLGACGPETQPASEAAATPEASATEAAAPAAPACAGTALPLTGLCTDAGDALYLKINSNHEMPAPHCVWTPQEAALSPDEALVFRALDCTQDDGPRMSFAFSGNVLTAAFPPFEAGGASYEMQALEIFPLDGETAEAVALKTLETAPENQRARCAVRPAEAAGAYGPAFTLSPSDELRAELEAAAEEGLYDACGLFGVTGSATWWEERPGKALFHSTGQDIPPWDTSSFTFYTRGTGGIWTRVE